MKLHTTRNDLKSNARKTSIEILNARLAEAIDLALLTKQAHWNIKGPRFIALHEMLDTFRADLDVHVDTIAERAVQLARRWAPRRWWPKARRCPPTPRTSSHRRTTLPR